MIKCEIRNKIYLFTCIFLRWVFFFAFLIIVLLLILFCGGRFFYGLIILFSFCFYSCVLSLVIPSWKHCNINYAPKIGQHFLVSIFQHDFETLGVTLKYDLWRTVGQCQGRRGGTQTPDPNKNLLFKDQKMVILSSRNRKK